MVLPAKLREKIGVKAEATFAGMGDKFQIWAPGAYSDDMERIDDWLDAQDEESDPFALLDRARLGG